MITYWLRVHCQWLLVTTSLAVWAATPHAAWDVACNAVAWLGAPAPTVAFVPREVEGFAGTPQSIPEPGTLALLAAGAMVLVAFRQ